MKEVFADTSYWVALVNWNDDLHDTAVSAAQSLVGVRIITTDGVLTEFLNYFAEFGAQMRETASGLVRTLLLEPGVEVIPQDRQAFLMGLEFYDQRRDKGYSLIDCISMRIMQERSIREVLTHDHHLRQEGFRPLLRPVP